MTVETLPAMTATGGIALIVSEQRLRFGDREVAVTRQISTVAACLVRNSPNMVTNSDLLRAMWPGEAAGPGDALRAIHVCKSLLRVHLANLAVPMRLETWRNVGCRLVPIAGQLDESLPVLSFAEVHFDQDTDCLFHEDRQVKLKPQVASAAACLLTHPEFVSDAMLREALWPNVSKRPDHDSNVRKVVMSRVRKALRDVNAPLFVERMAGGYRLGATLDGSSPVRSGIGIPRGETGQLTSE